MKLRRIPRVASGLVISIGLLVFAGQAYAQTEPGIPACVLDIANKLENNVYGGDLENIELDESDAYSRFASILFGTDSASQADLVSIFVNSLNTAYPALIASGFNARAFAEDIFACLNLQNPPISVTVTERELELIEGVTGQETGTVSVRLSQDPDPGADGLSQAVTLTSSDSGAVTISPAELVFTGQNWNDPQPVTVRAVADEDFEDEEVTLTILLDDTVVGEATVTVTVLDNPPPTVVASVDALNLVEGETGQETGTVSVRLSQDPDPGADGLSQAVTLTSSDSGAVTISPAELVFTGQNWNDPQPVTVRAVADEDFEDEEVTLTILLDDTVVGEATVTVTVLDNPPPTVVASVDALNLVEGETGQETGTVSVRLSQDPDPGADGLSQAVTLTSSDSGAVTISPAELVFTGQNWNDPQPVTVRAVADEDFEDEEVTLTILLDDTVVGEATVTVTVLDNPPPTVVASVDALNLVEGETGQETGTVSVRLSQDPDPGADGLSQAVTLTSSDSGAVTISPAELVFTGQNWNDPQPVTVRAVADEDFEDEEVTLTILLDDTVVGEATVTVTVLDNPPPTVVASVDALNLVEGETGQETGTVSVRLSQDPDPGADGLSQAVTLTSSDSGAVTISPAELVFTGQNWNDPQPVTVRAVADEDFEDEEVTLTILLDDTVVGEATVTVTVLDNPPPTVVASVDALNLVEGETGQETGTVSVRLSQDPDPGADGLSQAVTLTSSDSGAVTISPAELVFTGQNWNDPQPVTVRAVADEDATDEQVTLTFALDGNVVAATTVRVTVIDDDPPPPPPVTAVERKAVEKTVKAVVSSTVSNVTSNIGARFSSARTGGTMLNLAGFSVSTALHASTFDQPGSWDQSPGFSAYRSFGMSGPDLLRSSVFELTLGAAEDGSKGVAGSPQMTVWGRGDVLVFEKASNDDERYDANLFGGYLGVDTWLNDRWLVGIAGSKTKVDADYGGSDGGDLSLTLTGLHPYVRVLPNEQAELWAIVGLGFGNIENRNRHQGSPSEEKSSARTYMGAVGARWDMVMPQAEGFSVAALGDASFGRLQSEDGSGLQAIDNLAVDSWRARMGVEASYTLADVAGTTVTPIMELAGRYDGGGGEGEAGVELTGGVAIADPASGFAIEARAHTLLWYSDSDYGEYGGSLSASLSRTKDGEGLSLGLSSQAGAASQRSALLKEGVLGPTHTRAEGAAALSIKAEIGYSVALANSAFILTPFGAFQYARKGTNREERAGVRLVNRGLSKGDWKVELAGSRREHRSASTEHKVSVAGLLRF